MGVHAETDYQQHINTVFPDLANRFVDITPHFTDETNNIIGVSFVPNSEVGTPTVHMEYALSDNNEIVAYRLRIADETLIYQRKETQDGVPYGVFYAFDHPSGDEGPFELEISFGSADAGKFEAPEEAIGGVRYFANPPAVKEVVAGKIFAPDSHRESPVLQLGRKDPTVEAPPMQWESKLPGKREKGWLYLAKKEGTALTFRFQDPQTLVIKTIVIPFEFDREKVAQIAFSETEYDQEMGIANTQWEELESILDVQLNFFNANYSLSEYKTPGPGQDIVIKTTNIMPDSEATPPSDTVIGKVKSNIPLDPPAAIEVDDIDRFLGNDNLLAQINHLEEPVPERVINSTWNMDSKPPQLDSSPQDTLLGEFTKGDVVTLVIQQPDTREIVMNPGEDRVIRIDSLE